MPKPKKINLNTWERVQELPDLDGYQSLILTPHKLEDGTQLPDLYYRRGLSKFLEIDKVDEVDWHKNIRISKEGTETDYAYRVRWWFENAEKDEEYKEIINSTFNRKEYPLKTEWEKLKYWLIRQSYSSRKTFIHKFAWNWLTRNMHRHLSKQQYKK